MLIAQILLSAAALIPYSGIDLLSIATEQFRVPKTVTNMRVCGWRTVR